MMPFNIVELVLHKKYNLKGTNKQVGIKDRDLNISKIWSGQDD